MSRQQIFRQVALDRLASPEQLDTLLQIGSARSWLALLALLALLGAAIVWSVVGTIPTKVDAPAILVRPGGVFNAFARGSGRVAQVLVKEGDAVREGQLIASIEQPELVKEIESARVQLEEMRAQHEQLANYAGRDLTLRDEHLILQRRTLEDSIRFAQEQHASLTEQLTREEAVLARGLVTRQRVLQTRQAIFQMSEQLERARNELKQLAVVDLSSRSQREQELARSEMAINDAARRLSTLERNLELQSSIRSVHNGAVVEVVASPGNVVSPGAPIASLQMAEDGAGLEAVIYVQPTFGKNVALGMPAQISPLGSPREDTDSSSALWSSFPSSPRRTKA